MLATGIRTPVGIKVFGKDLGEMEELARQIEAVVKAVPGTTSAYAERTTGGYYLDIEPDRVELARYGLAVGDLLEVISVALGSELLTTMVEGRERFAVTVRYPRELREDPSAIASQVLIPVMNGAMIPLGQLASIKTVKAPPSIRTENALLSAYIFVDIRNRDIGGYVAEAQKAVSEQVKFSARILRDLERPVRIYGAGQAEAENSRAANIGNHFPASLPQFPAVHRNPHRHVVSAFFTGGRRLADMAAWLQSQCSRSCRSHRARRRGRGDGRSDADLS